MSFSKSSILVFLFAILFAQVLSASITKRSQSKRPYCQDPKPCGWAIYDKRTRFIEYFMENSCICKPGDKCLRDMDDVGISAYVYRCTYKDA